MKSCNKKFLYLLTIVFIICNIFSPTLSGVANSQALPAYLYKMSDSYELFFPDLNYSHSIPIDSSFTFDGKTSTGELGVFSKGEEVILFNFIENKIEPNTSYEDLHGLHLINHFGHYLFGVVKNRNIYDKNGNIVRAYDNREQLLGWTL